MKDICEICNEELVYATTSEDYKNLTCVFCNNIFETNVYCPNGHYICDKCHAEDPVKIIAEFCKKTELKNPFEIVNRIMSHPKFKMYGPEHHAITPAAILTALRNNNILKPNKKPITLLDIKEAINRGAKIPGGYCGFYGSCGAGIGSGIAVSIFTGSTPSHNIPRTLSNKMTSKALEKIADNLEHCCKRSVRISICEALNFLKEEFNIQIPDANERCPFSSANKKCEKEKCPMF